MSHASRVSILLPCLNARPFLQARVESLLGQTHTDWEAIVLDSFSEDGSWEFFQSVASTDRRFRLSQIPREGLYAALNRGLELASGEFLHIATCDDTMLPEFLATMLGALEQCPEAGIAACDLLLIDQSGNQLSTADLAGFMSTRGIKELLGAGTVRSALSPSQEQQTVNYRPPPHDCLLHFSGKSVYFSLNQLVIRTPLAKRAGTFPTAVGSIGDFGWLLRLTNFTGTVHVPRKLASWRFHGDQLSMQHDDSRVAATKIICCRTLPEIYARHYPLLSRNDGAILLLPCKRRLASTFVKRMRIWSEAGLRLLCMLLEHPVATTRTMWQARFRITVRQSLVPLVVRRMGCVPKPLERASKDFAKNAG